MDDNGASTMITHTRQNFLKFNPLKYNASSRLVPPLYMQILHHLLPPTRLNSRPPLWPLQHIPPPAYPQARPVYTSSDGAHETEARSLCKRFVIPLPIPLERIAISPSNILFKSIR